MDLQTVATYDRIARAFADQWWSTRLTSHMDRFSAGVPVGGLVLDLGCGPGRDAQWLDELGFTSVGADASFGMLEEARRRIGIAVPLVRSDLVALPLLGGCAAGAWACASLLHLTSDEASCALDEMARVVRPGGTIFVSVQAGDGAASKESPSGRRRFTYWRCDALCEVVERSGFDVTTAESAPPDPSTGVSWIAVHATRSAA